MGFDEMVLDALNPNGPVPVLDQAMVTLSIIGYSFIVVLISIILWYKGKKLEGVTFFLLVLTVEILSFLTKEAFARPRPDMTYLGAADMVPFPMAQYSFPSGHAMLAIAAGFFIYRIVRDSKEYWLVGIASVCIAVSISVSRLYIGVHYPSDVIAGAGIGLILGVLFTKLLTHDRYKSAILKKTSRRHN